MKTLLAIVAMILAILAAMSGCTPYQPGANNSPFEEEDTGYTLAFVIDTVSAGYRDRIVGNHPTGTQYMMKVKDIYFQERSEPTDRLVFSRVGRAQHAVIWDGKPRTFRKEVGTSVNGFANFLAKQSGSGGQVNGYDAVADTFDYLLKFRRRGKTAVLVFAEMRNESADPAKSREHLVSSLREFSLKGGHCAFYWLTWETCKEMEQIGKDAGLGMSYFVPDAVRDPVIPSFLNQ